MINKILLSQNLIALKMVYSILVYNLVFSKCSFESMLIFEKLTLYFANKKKKKNIEFLKFSQLPDFSNSSKMLFKIVSGKKKFLLLVVLRFGRKKTNKSKSKPSIYRWLNGN